MLVGAQPGSLQVADLDGDGDLDLLTANRGANTISVRYNNGRGVFSGTQSVLLSGPALTVITSDVDGDGDFDLITDNEILPASGATTVWRNSGTGTFSSAAVLATFDGGGEFSTGDVDGDGDLDLFTSSLLGVKVCFNRLPLTVTGFSPASGPTGTVVSVQGTNMIGVRDVTIGTLYGPSLTNLTVVSNTLAQATIPPGAASGPLLVTRGTTTLAAPSPFTVTTSITDFTPLTGGTGNRRDHHRHGVSPA